MISEYMDGLVLPVRARAEDGARGLVGECGRGAACVGGGGSDVRAGGGDGDVCTGVGGDDGRGDDGDGDGSFGGGGDGVAMCSSTGGVTILLILRFRSLRTDFLDTTGR